MAHSRYIGFVEVKRRPATPRLHFTLWPTAPLWRWQNWQVTSVGGLSSVTRPRNSSRGASARTDRPSVRPCLKREVQLSETKWLLCFTQWSRISKSPAESADDVGFVRLDLRVWTDLQRHEHQQSQPQIQVNRPTPQIHYENRHNKTNSRLWCAG